MNWTTLPPFSTSSLSHLVGKGSTCHLYKIFANDCKRLQMIAKFSTLFRSRLTPWLLVWGVYCVSLVFPALDTDYKKMLSFGIWKESDVGYNKTAPPPYE